MFGIKTLERKLRREFNEDLKRGSEIMTLHSKTLAEFKQYCECSVCGALVNKEKAEMKQEMRDKVREIVDTFYSLIVDIETGEKEIVKVYTCKNCQKAKKSKK